MKILLIVSLLLLVSSSSSFKLFSDIVEDNGFYGNTLADKCSQSRVSSIFSAIAGCERTQPSQTTYCIIDTLFEKTKQRWDAYAGLSDAQSAVTYWYYSNCSIVLNNYGPYGRTYKVWSAETFSSQNSEKTPVMSSAPSEECSDDRVNSVQIALKNCQNSSESDSTDCIQKLLKQDLNEYWDVYATMSSYSSDVDYWYYDYCSLLYAFYGPFERTYFIWKAQ